MATATKKTINPVFAGLRCPLCGELDSVHVKLESLELTCSSCGDDIARDEVTAMVATWNRLVAWLDSASPLTDGK